MKKGQFYTVRFVEDICVIEQKERKKKNISRWQKSDQRTISGKVSFMTTSLNDEIWKIFAESFDDACLTVDRLCRTVDCSLRRWMLFVMLHLSSAEPDH